jgi:phosphotransferase system enzyme I (PtsI)
VVPPDEETQFNIYKQLLLAAEDAQVTIRVLDIGGDKLPRSGGVAVEDNPFLGLRGIRFCLYGRRDLFETQLRALLRAGIYGNLRVMLPMVSTVGEVLETRDIIHKLQEQLAAENREFVKNLTLGVMIETPVAALQADHLAGVVDFFSIGTNDLVQYTMAIDRGNEQVAYLYRPANPAVLKLIRHVVECAEAHHIHAGVCGQMAADPLHALLLLGLGVHELSMAPSAVPAVRRAIRSVSMYELEQLAKEALAAANAAEASAELEKLLAERVPELITQE